MIFRKITPSDIDSLQQYLEDLDDQAKDSFNPHGYGAEDIGGLVANLGGKYEPFIALDADEKIVAYFFAQKGISDNDRIRLERAGIPVRGKVIFSFAPSISFAHRGTGIGAVFYNVMEKHLKEMQVDYIVLLGGVDTSNERAVSYYKKIGFLPAGTFTRDGEINFTMYKNLGSS